jgi:hypothetical protein
LQILNIRNNALKCPCISYWSQSPQSTRFHDLLVLAVAAAESKHDLRPHESELSIAVESTGMEQPIQPDEQE